MGSIVQNGMIVFIIGSACCVLVGIIMTAVRVVKLIRRERITEIQNKIWAKRQIQEANVIRSERYKGSEVNYPALKDGACWSSGTDHLTKQQVKRETSLDKFSQEDARSQLSRLDVAVRRTLRVST